MAKGSRGRAGSGRGQSHRSANEARVIHGDIDINLLGIEPLKRKIPEKPHCPECGRIYTGKGKKKGVVICGYCERRSESNKGEERATHTFIRQEER